MPNLATVFSAMEDLTDKARHGYYLVRNQFPDPFPLPYFFAGCALLLGVSITVMSLSLSSAAGKRARVSEFKENHACKEIPLQTQQKVYQCQIGGSIQQMTVTELTAHAMNAVP